MGSGISKSLREENEINELKDAPAAYEVNIKMDKSYTSEFMQWITAHMTELRVCPGFVKCEYFKEEKNIPTVVFVLGGPGSGKGTQCERIVKEFGFGHISAGDCLREEQASGSSDAELINQYIKEGKLVPIDIVIKLLIKKMKKSDKHKFLIDGFPRSLENLEGWRKHVNDKANVTFVLYLDCPENVMEQRLLERGKTSGRADDNIETIKKRFNTFQEQTKPIIDLYRQENRLRHIHAEKTLEEVWAEVHQAFQELETQQNTECTYTLHYRFANCRALKDGEKDILPKLEASVPERLSEKLHIQTRYLLNAKEL